MATQELWQLHLGAWPIGPSKIHFRVWAPYAKRVTVDLVSPPQLARNQPIQLKPCEHGYFEATVCGIEPGARYRYVLDGPEGRVCLFWATIHVSSSPPWEFVDFPPSPQCIVYSQNHDQVGNPTEGGRLSTVVPRDALKVAVAACRLAPNIPLLLMGEEYGETTPFLYFLENTNKPFLSRLSAWRSTWNASRQCNNGTNEPPHSVGSMRAVG